MSKVNEHIKLIPNLRFPEFEDSGEWEIDLFSNFIKLYRGSSPRPINKFLTKNENGVNWIKIGDTKYAKSYVLGKVEQKITIEGSKKSTRVTKGELILANSMSYGATYELQINGCIYDGWFVLREYAKSFNKQYLLQLLNSNFLQQQYKRLAAGGIVKNISSEIVYNTKLPKPSKQEQQKIAAFLSNLDELIEAHKQKLEWLKRHKKGLMQNHFPQEGEKVPKWRFPEFKDSGEWVEKKLGEIANFINGRAYKQDELLSEGKYRVLRVGNFFTNNEWYFSDLELDEDKYCDNGDLLYAWSASFGPRIWKGEKVIYHYHIWKVKNKEEVDKQFLYNLLDYETLRMKSKTLNGFALMHITKGTIENWDSIIPKSKKEQQKIASCLSSIDEIITAEAEKIVQLERHKKGLMQGLFPQLSAL